MAPITVNTVTPVTRSAVLALSTTLPARCTAPEMWLTFTTHAPDWVTGKAEAAATWVTEEIWDTASAPPPMATWRAPV